MTKYKVGRTFERHALALRSIGHAINYSGDRRAASTESKGQALGTSASTTARAIDLGAVIGSVLRGR